MVTAQGPGASLAFDLEYDGPALRAHEMDVRDLAPALLATAELFQESNRVLDPAAPGVVVNVRATSEGSFLVELKLLYDATVEVLSGPHWNAAVNLSALVGVIGGLMAYLKKKRTADVVAQDSTEEPGIIRITFADGTTLEIPERVLDLANNVRVRRSLAEVVRPITREGIDTVRVRRDDLVVGEVTTSDAAAFAAEDFPAPDRDVLSTRERDVYLSIVNAAFQKGNKWRLSDGQVTFHASVLDENFLNRVERGERFSKLDVLHCRIRDVQWRDENGLHSETEVLQVLNHLPPAQQSLIDDELGT